MGTSSAVQWLRIRASNAGEGLIIGGGTKIPQTTYSTVKRLKVSKEKSSQNDQAGLKKN